MNYEGSMRVHVIEGCFATRYAHRAVDKELLKYIVGFLLCEPAELLKSDPIYSSLHRSTLGISKYQDDVHSLTDMIHHDQQVFIAAAGNNRGIYCLTDETWNKVVNASEDMQMHGLTTYKNNVIFTNPAVI